MRLKQPVTLAAPSIISDVMRFLVITPHSAFHPPGLLAHNLAGRFYNLRLILRRKLAAGSQAAQGKAHA